MRLGIDASRAVSARPTGTEGYAYHLTRALLPLTARRGHQVVLYFNRPPAPDLFLSNAQTQIVVLPFPRLWTHLRLALELHRRPPDVFFTPAHVVPVTYRGPSAATVHDLGYHYYPQAHTRRQVAYLRWSTRHNVHRSRRVFADSQATRDDIVRFYGVEVDKIEVVYPGVDPDVTAVRDEKRLRAVREKYGIPAPYLLYLGTLQPRKNLARLVEAFVAADVAHHLVLAGKRGWLAQMIEEAVASLPPAAAARVHLTGFVDEADKAALISGADGLLYPSLHEGFGFPVVEAQLCGTPVLCADSSSLPEVAGAGALLVDATDTEALTAAIERLAGDEVLRSRLVDAGRVNAQRFTWERAAEQVLASLEMVADGAR